jgi:hypothetical protein
MTDLLEKLDERINRADHGVDRQMAREAKAEIEKLRAENERFRALLEEAASDLTDWTIFWKISDALGWEKPHG